MTEKKMVADLAREDGKSLINFSHFLIVFFSVVLVLLLSVPKIYLANEIYYTSKKLHKLRVQTQSLKQEHILLQRKIEHMKFKNSVIYTMF